MKILDKKTLFLFLVYLFHVSIWSHAVHFSECPQKYLSPARLGRIIAAKC